MVNAVSENLSIISRLSKGSNVDIVEDCDHLKGHRFSQWMHDIVHVVLNICSSISPSMDTLCGNSSRWDQIPNGRRVHFHHMWVSRESFS